MTSRARADVIEALGFTRPQAGFLAAVAAHGGYCVRRQYLASAHRRHCRAAYRFLDGLVDRDMVRRLTYGAHRGHVYHLCSRRLYAVMGLGGSDSRRHVAPGAIARRLMLLDFVLTEPDLDWYATRAEKRALFVDRMGLQEAILPPRRIQRLPLFLLGEPPSVHFVCVVTDPHAAAIASFVRDHAPLLRQLSDWTIHAVIPRGAVLDGACAKAYDRALKAVSLSALSGQDLEWFDRTRALVLQGNVSGLSIADLSRYRELAPIADRRGDVPAPGSLAVHVLPHSYVHFGPLARLP